MFGNNEYLAALLSKYLNDELSEEESREFGEYLNNPVYADALKELLGEEFRLNTIPNDIIPPHRNKILDKIFQRLPVTTTRGNSRQLWYSAGLAAAMIICLLGGIVFFHLKRTVEAPPIVYASDVGPGRNAATLTLPDGRILKLGKGSNKELLNAAGLSVRELNAELVYHYTGSTRNNKSIHTLSTARGEIFHLRLPDGSLVVLNSASTLSYSGDLLDHGRRNVKLSGEAYFEVAKDKDHPFWVQTQDQTVQVLGTHFNVRSYEGERLKKTTLVEGMVRISSAVGEQKLSAGQQALYDGHVLEVKPANVVYDTAWKDGFFRFDNTLLPIIMQQLALWYDIEIRYSGKISSERFTGRISRDKPVSEVLKMLESTGFVRFKIEGREVTVME